MTKNSIIWFDSLADSTSTDSKEFIALKSFVGGNAKIEIRGQPQQRDTYNCGIALLLFFLNFFDGGKIEKNMNYHRVKFAMDILNKK